MKLPIAKASSFRSAVLFAVVTGWLATSLVGQPAAETMDSFVEDDALLLSEEKRDELNQKLAKFRDDSECWILVKTAPHVMDRTTLDQIFGEAWVSWNHPPCAVVFYFILEASSARMILAPGLADRLASEEIGAILLGVVGPRFQADDPEGAVLAGVESLQVALTGDLEELPNPFRPRGTDRPIGMALIVLALVAFSGAAYQLARVVKGRRPDRKRAS